MKIVHTFWSKPLRRKGTSLVYDRFAGGWTDKSYNYMSWMYSCLQFRKYYDQVELITDTEGKRLLIDILQLPYTNVQVVLDDLNNYHHGLWALGKIMSYSLQREPFIHADGDVYIYDRFDAAFENSALVSQNEEKDFPYYKEVIKGIGAHQFVIPEAIAWYEKSGGVLSAVNAGVIGGQDVEFFHNFSRKVFEFVDKNYSSLLKMDTGSTNIYFEQYFCYCLAKQSGIPVTYLFDNIEYNFKGLDEFLRTPTHKKYVHAVGVCKTNEMKGEELAMQLQSNYPVHYYTILKYLHDQII